MGKLLFPTYNPKVEVYKWKSICLLALAAHKSAHYCSFVITNLNGERTFDPNMSGDKCIQLFNLTLQALDPIKCNMEFISTQMINEADNPHLWECTGRRFKLAEKNDFDKDELK